MGWPQPSDHESKLISKKGPLGTYLYRLREGGGGGGGKEGKGGVPKMFLLDA